MISSLALDRTGGVWTRRLGEPANTEYNRDYMKYPEPLPWSTASATATLALMSDDLKKRIGRRLRALRKRRGLTQEQLAEIMDCSVDTVGNIERGRTLAALETLDRLSRSLSIPMAELFDDGVPMSPARAGTEAQIRDVLRQLDDVEAVVALRLIEALLPLRDRASKNGR